MPTAHLDSRCSTPGAGRVARRKVPQGLGEDLYRVITVRAAARPHVTPLAVVLDDAPPYVPRPRE